MKRLIPAYSSFDFFTKFRGRQFYITSTRKEVDKFEVYQTYRLGGIQWDELCSNDSWIKHKQKIGWRFGKLICK